MLSGPEYNIIVIAGVSFATQGIYRRIRVVRKVHFALLYGGHFAESPWCPPRQRPSNGLVV